MMADSTRHARRIEIMQHALGLDMNGQGRAYRNHFVTGPGSKDWDDCCELVDAGLMEDRGKSVLTGGDHCFTVTQAGRTAVRTQSPEPPKLTPGQRRYRKFLDQDSGLSFGEWLRMEGRRP